MGTHELKVKIDAMIYADAQITLGRLGLDFDTAVTMFFSQVVREQAIPFRIGAPKPPKKSKLAEKDYRVRIYDFDGYFY